MTAHYTALAARRLRGLVLLDVPPSNPRRERGRRRHGMGAIDRVHSRADPKVVSIWGEEIASLRYHDSDTRHSDCLKKHLNRDIQSNR